MWGVRNNSLTKKKTWAMPNNWVRLNVSMWLTKSGDWVFESIDIRLERRSL